MNIERGGDFVGCEKVRVESLYGLGGVGGK